MTSYLNLDKPIEIQVELTTKCNAMCPMCARVDENRAKGQYLNPYMPFEADMKFETWEKMFDKWSLSKVYRIDHTPVFGDPLASSIFLDTVEYMALRLLINQFLKAVIIISFFLTVRVS